MFKPLQHRQPVFRLALLAGLDAALQAAVFWLPSPFAGIGLAGFALLPVLGVWYLCCVLVVMAGLPLAYLCFRERWLVPLGVALLALCALNVTQAWRAYAEQQPTPAERAERTIETAKADEVYRCMAQWFAVPRRAVDVRANVLIFEGGVAIDVCRMGDPLCGGDPASVARREAFGRFAKAHVVGHDVRVSLPDRSFFRYEGGNWCANGLPLEQTVSGFQGRYTADVLLRTKRLTVTDSPLRLEEFP